MGLGTTRFPNKSAMARLLFERYVEVYPMARVLRALIWFKSPESRAIVTTVTATFDTLPAVNGNESVDMIATCEFCNVIPLGVNVVASTASENVKTSTFRCKLRLNADNWGGTLSVTYVEACLAIPLTMAEIPLPLISKTAPGETTKYVSDVFRASERISLIEFRSPELSVTLSTSPFVADFILLNDNATEFDPTNVAALCSVREVTLNEEALTGSENVNVKMPVAMLIPNA